MLIDELVKELSKYKIAFAHDYLIKNGGAENCLRDLHELFPHAPVYTLLYDEEATQRVYKDWDIRTSYLQKRAYVSKLINYYRLVMPQAVESFDLSEYDIVISDASSFIKGIITQPNTFHLCYVHTPTRFLWFDIGNHINRAKFASVVKSFVPYVLHKMRIWDTISAQRPDLLVSNSETTRSRVRKFYHRDSVVINPPVNIEIDAYKDRLPKNYYLVVSRLEPHKDIEIAIRAAIKANVKLKIAGEGADLERLRSISNKNIQFLGRVSDNEKEELMLGAIAFLAPQTEDFGITMVEALSFGCPVITNDAGGGSEIVQDGKTGILIKDIDAIKLAEVMTSNKSYEIKAVDCAKSAEKYSSDNYKVRMLKEIIKNVR